MVPIRSIAPHAAQVHSRMFSGIFAVITPHADHVLLLGQNRDAA
jgi:hypothetical protein